jgi:hypothetical protein
MGAMKGEQEQNAPAESLRKCQGEITRMLRNSQTRIIAPIITFGLLGRYVEHRQREFTDGDVRRCYDRALEQTRQLLGHDLHLGANYYDAYGSRLSRYGVVRPIAHLTYRLEDAFCESAIDFIEMDSKRYSRLCPYEARRCACFSFRNDKASNQRNRGRFYQSARIQSPNQRCEFRDISFRCFEDPSGEICLSHLPRYDDRRT